MILLVFSLGGLVGYFLNKFGITFPNEFLWITLVTAIIFVIEVYFIILLQDRWRLLRRLTLDGVVFGYFSLGFGTFMLMKSLS